MGCNKWHSAVGSGWGKRRKRFEQSCYVKLELMSRYLWKDFNSDRICWSREILLCVARIKIQIEFMFLNQAWAESWQLLSHRRRRRRHLGFTGGKIEVDNVPLSRSFVAGQQWFHVAHMIWGIMSLEQPWIPLCFYSCKRQSAAVLLPQWI